MPLHRARLFAWSGLVSRVQREPDSVIETVLRVSLRLVTEPSYRKHRNGRSRYKRAIEQRYRSLPRLAPKRSASAKSDSNDPRKFLAGSQANGIAETICTKSPFFPSRKYFGWQRSLEGGATIYPRDGTPARRQRRRVAPDGQEKCVAASRRGFISSATRCPSTPDPPPLPLATASIRESPGCVPRLEIWKMTYRGRLSRRMRSG